MNDAAYYRREKTLRDLLRLLATARDNRAEWYVWIRDSYPVLKRGK